MDKESSRGIGMRLLAPRLNNRNLIFSAPPEPALASAKAAAGKSTLGRALQCDALAFLPHSTDYKLLHIHTYHLPTPDPRLRRFETASLTSGSVTSAGKWLQVWMAACQSWITSPVAKSCVYGVLCAFVAEVFFPVLTLYSPRSIVWGLFFSPYIPHVMLYFSSIPCLPVLSTPLSYMYVVYGQVDG